MNNNSLKGFRHCERSDAINRSQLDKSKIKPTELFMTPRIMELFNFQFYVLEGLSSLH